MLREDKEQLVGDLAERLKATDTLIVADYRGLTMPQIQDLRAELDKHGARFQVVKNTLTRRAAEQAGADALLPLLAGPSAIAFVEADGDPAAVAKALAAAARETRVLEIRGGVMQARALSAEDVDELSKLPSLEVLRGQVIGAILGPLNAIAGLVRAPLQDLYGLVDARIQQLEEQGEGAAADEPAAEPEPEPEPETAPEPAAEAEPATEEETETESPQPEAAEEEE